MNVDRSDPRIAAFNAKRIRHALLDQALADVQRLVDYPHAESVVVLVGPSGVGKSLVIKALERHLLTKYAAEIADDPGFIPFLSVKLNAPLDGNFNWKDFFIRTLLGGGEVQVDRKRSSGFEAQLDGHAVSAVGSLVREELRRSLESMVHNRRVKAILADEASAMLYQRAGMKRTLPFDILKCLAIELRIPMILSGAYDLLGIREGTGQLLRRSEIIHFRRYSFSGRVGDVSHRQVFADVLATLLSAMDIPQETGLSEQVDFFFAKSIGCVGVLKDWLARSMAAAIASGGRLTNTLLMRHALSNRDLIKMAAEADFGERALVDSTDDDLAAALGLPMTPSLSLGHEACPASAVPPRSPHPRRVGLRGPSRDPVGVSND